MGKRKRASSNSFNQFEIESKFIYAANVLSTREDSAIDSLNAQLQEVYDSLYNQDISVFLNVYFDVVKNNKGHDDIHKDIQTLIDVADINDIIINNVGKHLELLITSV
jgi:hypothetical protein